MTPKAALETALARAGSRVELARALGVDKSNVTHWLRDGVPPKHVGRIERMYGVPASDLRPDFFGENAGADAEAHSHGMSQRRHETVSDAP